MANVMSKSTTRVLMALVCAFMMLGLIWVTSRDALASLHASGAAKNASLVSIDKAISLSGPDADAHLLRGALLEANDDLASAITEYEQATALRPEDYVLWLTLARGRELNGEQARAIAAARMAVPLAPFYAQPHWQLGNLLVRAGQTAEGFKELRLASSTNPDFLSPVIDLAWQLSKGDVQFVENTIVPKNAVEYAALAECFKLHGQVDDAIEMLAFVGPDSKIAQRRQQFINELIAAKNFKEAYRLWSMGGSSESDGARTIIDGGFERETNLDESGFGWHAENKAPSITRALDSSSVKEGRLSLRIDFNGDSDPNVSVISQFVLIEPHAHYRLQFAARAEEIVSGGLPLVRVVDAATGTVLGEATGISQSKDWRDYSIDFAGGDSTSAIQIILLRSPCNARPCPIFGRLWLDALSLQKSETPAARA